MPNAKCQMLIPMPNAKCHMLIPMQAGLSPVKFVNGLKDIEVLGNGRLKIDGRLQLVVR